MWQACLRHWIPTTKWDRHSLCPHHACGLDTLGIALTMCYKLKLTMKAVVSFSVPSFLLSFLRKHPRLPLLAPASEDKSTGDNSLLLLARQAVDQSMWPSQGLICKGVTGSGECSGWGGGHGASSLLITAKRGLRRKGPQSKIMLFLFHSKVIFTLIAKFLMFWKTIKIV